jgi:hypothetical protein
MSALANDLDAQQTPRANANAANAQHSCGPTSQAGKDRSKFNALKSGIFARTVVLPHEDQAAYEAIGVYLSDQWKPATDTQREIVLTIQNTTWRLNRVVELESSLYAISAEQQSESIAEQFPDQDPSALAALARAAGYLANLRAFDQLSRQEGRLQRILDRAKKEIITLISQRIPDPPPVPPVTEEVAAEPAPAPPATPIGFVPPKYPRHMPSFSGPQAKEHRRAWLRKNGIKNQE